MRKHIPDTWAHFFGLVIVKLENDNFTQPVGFEEFVEIIKDTPHRIFDEMKYRQRFLFLFLTD
jgi:hypothetical protein